MNWSVVSQLPPLQQLQQSPPPSTMQAPQQAIDPNFMSKLEVKRRLDIAHQQWIDPKHIIDEMINRGYTLEWLNDGSNKQYDKEQIRLQQQPIQDLAQGGIKWMPLNQQEDKERNDNLIPRMNPWFKHTEKDDGAPNAMKLIGNAIPSAWNVVADVGNMVLNPYDTAKGLVQTISWAGVNLGKRWLSQLDADAPEKIDANIQALKWETWFMWWLARTLETNEQVADAVAGAIAERYGSSDNFAKTMTEDPVGVISDIALLFETWWAGLSKVAKTWWATKLADVASDVSKFANKYDPYNFAMDQGIKGIGQGMQKMGELTNSTKNFVSSSLKRSFDRLEQEKTGLSKEEIRGIQSNPFQSEYWEKTKQIIESTGVPTTAKEVIRPHLEEIGESLTSLINQAKGGLSDSWPLYDEVRKLKTSVSLENVHVDLQNMLSKNDILFKSDWSLDFSNSRYIQSRDTSAISAVVKRILNQSLVDASGILNLRKAIDSATKRDGAPIESTSLLKKIRKLVDAQAKQTIPQLKELDEAYRKQIKELNEVQEWLIYRQGNRKGTIRDNFMSIIKNLGWENRARMRERLLKLMPDIEERIDAINNLPKLSKAYTQTPKFSKAMSTATVALAGGALYWREWLVWWAVIGRLSDNLTQGIRRRAVDKVFSEIWPETQQKLKEINEKIENNKQLKKDEVDLLNSIKAKLQAEQQKGDELKPNPIPPVPNLFDQD